MRQNIWQRILLYAVVIFWCFVCLFPFYWLLTTSFKTPLAVSRGPRYLPFVDYQPTFDHWRYLFIDQQDALFRHFRNSLIAASGSTLLAVIIGAMGGYGLARYRYHWRRVLHSSPSASCRRPSSSCHSCSSIHGSSSLTRTSA